MPCHHLQLSMGCTAISVGAVSWWRLPPGCSPPANRTPPRARRYRAAGPWTFTDDRGVEVTRPSRPSRIATNDKAGAALTSLGVRPVGIFSSARMDQNPILNGVDVAGIQSLGDVYGEIMSKGSRRWARTCRHRMLGPPGNASRTPVPRSVPRSRPNPTCSPLPSTPPPARGSPSADPRHSPVCVSCSSSTSSSWYRRAKPRTSMRTSPTSSCPPSKPGRSLRFAGWVLDLRAERRGDRRHHRRRPGRERRLGLKEDP